MLTTGRRSRLRLALGGTAVAALMLTGLAGTASGTAAASTVRAGVEKATGLDIATLDKKFASKLQDVPAAPSAGSVPLPVEPPMAPEEADVPPPPAAPRVTRTTTTTDTATTTTDEGNTLVVSDGPDGKKVVKRVKYVRLGKNGEVMNEDFRNLADIPEVRSANCGLSGNGKAARENVVVNRVNGKQRVMIICHDRIEAMSENAVAEATKASMSNRDIQKMAYARALVGLRSARAGIAANTNMPGRSEALARIDESIREMQSDMAKND